MAAAIDGKGDAQDQPAAGIDQGDQIGKLKARLAQARASAA